jgi:cell division protein FtsA
VQGLTDVVASPTHATAVGLVRHAASLAAQSHPVRSHRPSRSKAGQASKPLLNSENASNAASGLWERIKGMFKNFF